MNVARALAIAAWVLVGSAQASTPAASAKEKLDAAREQLKAAVARIQADPPSTTDLDAAHAAVGVLKEAIDAGAEHEATDLDYAKAALGARKELRTQREYVDQRRANVHIHNHRRTVDAALSALAERARASESKDATPKEFDDTRAAIAATRKLLKEAQAFAKDDAKFASYLTETENTVTRHEKALDDLWTLLAVDKHRAVVEESRQALAKALASLTPAATDAQFEEGDRASAQLSKLLEEGKAFEPRDKAYRTVAEKARAELTQTKKRLEELVASTSLTRLTSQIDPARADLATALKEIRVKKPTEEQLAEARTAAIVVRKLVEKFQPQASHSEAFAKYIADVTKTLVEVELDLQRRSLDAARAEVAQAMKNLEKRSATDEQFEELNTALTVLQKTVETVHKKLPTIAERVLEARQQTFDAKALLARRRIEIDVERQRNKAQEARKTAETLVKQLQQGTLTAEQLQEAENAVKQLRAVMEEGTPLIKKYGDYKAYDLEMKDRIAQMNERIASRRIVLAASNAKARLTENIADGREKLDVAKQPDSKDADVDAATKSVNALMESIEANTGLEKQDYGYGLHAEKARAELLRQTETLEAATTARALRRETGDALAAGVAAVNEAARLQDLRKQNDLYRKALARFKSCAKEGAERLGQTPELIKVVVLVDGNPSNANEVVKLCEERTQTTEPLHTHVLALIAFEDGPKLNYEAAKTLLAKSKKPEAMQKFEDCISSGIYAQHKYPELKQGKFEVAGASTTVAELVQQCVTHRKALLVK